MDFSEFVEYCDLDMKFNIGDLEFEINHIRYTPTKKGWHIWYHSHKSYELHYIVSGKGTLIANNQTYSIEPGVFFFTGPDVRHEQFTDDNDPLLEHSLDFNFKTASLTDNTCIDLLPEETSFIYSVLCQTKFSFGSDDFDTFLLFEKIHIELLQRFKN